jgi:hypothetical protein
MTNSNFSEPDKMKPRSATAVLYAVLVPVLVVIFQSAYVVTTGWGFRYNALLGELDHPAALGGMFVVALVSFAAIRPFARKPDAMWIAFLLCLTAFSMAAITLSPGVAE